MSFSLSTFTLEIDGKPTLVFEAKWQIEADDICRCWVQTNWDQIPKRSSGKTEFRPELKMRLASAIEKAAYQTEAAHAELYGEVPVVKLGDTGDGR